MKTNEIELNECYMAKITDRVVPVQIISENPRGGWNAVNMVTTRKCRIKSARKLRSRATKEQIRDANDQMVRADNTKYADKALERTTTAVEKTEATTDTKKVNNATRANKANPKREGILTIAARILTIANEPMSCKAIVNEAITKMGWTTKGKTPHCTLYAAIIREIANKGEHARFIKVDRGQFTINHKEVA